MLRYVLRRFLLLIPMVLAASVIIFLMLRLGTGDPALDYLRLSNLPPTPEMLASTRTMLGLDQPLYVQYGTWLWKALHLDFGISFASQRPVLDDMLNFLPATLELADDRGIDLICVGTDGTDGPTDAAGGYAFSGDLARLRAIGLHPKESLDANDSYPLLLKAGTLLRTGPTRTNVMDMAIMLVRPK